MGLRGPLPLPPSADDAKSDKGEEERRGLGDRVSTADYGSHKGVDIESVDFAVKVNIGEDRFRV